MKGDTLFPDGVPEYPTWYHDRYSDFSRLGGLLLEWERWESKLSVWEPCTPEQRWNGPWNLLLQDAPCAKPEEALTLVTELIL